MFENNNGQNRINNIMDDSNYGVKKKKGMPAWAIALIVIVGNIVISCMIILGIGFGISLLFNNTNTNTDTDTQEKKSVNGLALEYMEEKYGERFYYYSPWGNSLSDTRQFLAVCDSMPDQQVLVQIDNYRTDNKVFRDNYLAVKYQQEVTDYLYEKVTKYYSNVQVLHIPSKWALSPDLAANADLNTYLEDENCFINAHIVLDDSEISTKERIEEFASSITECNGEINLSVLFLEDTTTKYTSSDYLENMVGKREYVQFAHVSISREETRIDWYKGNGKWN